MTQEKVREIDAISERKDINSPEFKKDIPDVLVRYYDLLATMHHARGEDYSRKG